MSTSTLNLLSHIRDEAEFLRRATENISAEQFGRDEVLKRACARSIGIIGEATKKIPEEVKALYPQIEWKRMAGMRDRVIHDYLGVDNAMVYDVAHNRSKDLCVQIGWVISREGKEKSHELEP
jgi:uncharacterized protein with HEPN domain